MFLLYLLWIITIVCINKPKQTYAN